MTLTLPARASSLCTAPSPALSSGSGAHPLFSPIGEPADADGLCSAVRDAAAAGHRVSFRASARRGRLRADAGDPARLSARTVVDLSTEELTGIAVDASRRVAQVGAGVTWAALERALATSGLTAAQAIDRYSTVAATILQGGYSSSRRVGGTPAGAMRAAEIVDADARRRWVDDTIDPQLMWALRGGGGGLVAVTAVEIDLADAPVHRERLRVAIDDCGRRSAALGAYRDALGALPSTTVLAATFSPEAGCADPAARVLTIDAVGTDALVRDHPAMLALRELARPAETPPAVDLFGPRADGGSAVSAALPLATVTEAALVSIARSAQRPGCRGIELLDLRDADPGRPGIGSAPRSAFVAVVRARVDDARSLAAFRREVDDLTARLAPWIDGQASPGSLAPWRSLAGSYSAAERRWLRDIAARVDPDALFHADRAL